MKTAISIPDHVFRQAERLARRLKKSRSQLYSEAVSDYVARHDEDAITEAINRALDEAGPDQNLDAFAGDAARRTFERLVPPGA